jgi:pyruvate,water dikinase
MHSGFKSLILFRLDGYLYKGDVAILVSSFPEITVAMSKIGAIVVDSGGILCRAAIIAREYGVPCGV